MHRTLWILAAAVPVLASCGAGRSAQSLLPQNVRRVAIHYHPAQHHPDQYAVITQRRALHEIIRAFNALPLASNGTTTCAADFGQYLNLTFSTSQGRIIHVHDWLACHQLSISTSPQRLFGQGKFSPLVLQLMRHP